MATKKAGSANKQVPFIPTHFSVTRSLNPGLFFMSGRTAEGALKPVLVAATTVRGTQSHYVPDAVGAIDAVCSANPQRIERAYLPAGCDTLVVKGSIRVIGGARAPETCSNPEYRAAHNAFLDAFEGIQGFDLLAERYLMNIINGRWLWRNRFSPSVAVSVSCEGVSETFDANDMSAGFALSFDALPVDKQPKARAIGQLLAQALAHAGSGAFARFIDIEAHVMMREGAEVFPSQEFVEKEETKKKGQAPVGRILAKRPLADGTMQAVMHDQKVGNGVRTIDTWYSADGDAISVEPYGSVPRLNEAKRVGEGTLSFYQMQDDLLALTANVPERKNDALFFGAMLVRGGLFGRSAKPAKASEE